MVVKQGILGVIFGNLKRFSKKPTYTTFILEKYLEHVLFLSSSESSKKKSPMRHTHDRNIRLKASVRLFLTDIPLVCTRL
ncbi:hypothetical protein AB205_0038410 [Aquarana catesbeiana]|uniref:Uncharacterized protein n=1 Tax=Aquarana catesbeiana TaxID=8400 RepID=A0A2G9S6I0_AQUCT|nr:hypothetical protein AB205_0038410 [Aquarana catesbeiana]